MKFIPHEYQQYSIDFIKNNKIAALLLEMGLGKTVTTLTAIKDLMHDDFSVKKVLIVAPLRVAQSTWPNEIEKWDHLKDLTYSVVLGTPKQRKEALWKKADLYLINRENLDWLITKSGFDFDFDMVVIDELSSFKNYKSKRFTSFMQVRHKVDRIVGLTGTPSSNGLMDLFAEFKVLDMGERLEYYISRYRDKYFLPDKRNGLQIYSWKPRENAEQEIYNKISDIAISMKSVDFLDMPELVNNEVPVSLGETEKLKYDKFKADLVLQLKDADIDAANAAVLSNKLLQMANGAIYDEFNVCHHIHDQKLDALEDLIEGANGKPILIAYWFQHDLERIKEWFKVRQIKTATDIEEWNKGNIPVAVIHPASAGHGLNLQTGGSNLVWFGLTWSLELYQQTNARLWRQGQNETVVIHHIIAKDTIDEDVMLALKLKDKTQSSLIDAVKARLEGEG
ncbi:DEAD/DEAH box helicase [Lactococcus petauri]|uniref:DEAD/DEAH box helicase n=1 Tax=Lactococcus petauri TaxID=1940789 RepID=UPI0022E34385|nr:DEAD/DEAH box helicase [Lactococcus petauri]